jgi:hypothetical protein
LWYVDEATGIWKEEGTAVRNGNNYVGEVKHFSFWNFDYGLPSVTLSATLKNSHGSPIVGALVRITRPGANLWIQSYGYTDSLGKVSGLVPSNENLVLEVMDPCLNPVYTQNISPLTQNTDLGVITVSNTSSGILTVTGRLLDCTGAPVTNGYAIISFNNTVRYASVNNSGQYSVTFVTCSASATVCEVIGVDQSTQQQGNPATISITTPATNAGDIAACGVSSSQFINYTLNGTDYSLTSAMTDSIMAYTYQQGAVPYTTIISGFHIASNNAINFRFASSAQVAGVYPLDRLYLHNYQRIGLIAPFNVTVTNFPTIAGGFYEGSFSGQFRDSANLVPLHTLNGTFRIRR